MKHFHASETPEQKFSSGVFMTVWQSAPHRPEVQILMNQQDEINMLKGKINEHEMRLQSIEARVQELENIVNSFAATFTLILNEDK